jgi:NTP pyrophosphatase (non-canonical NTP hydrolase)
MNSFNNLSPEEAERLDWLAEECAEVIKAISKIKRHGYESSNPHDPDHKGNRYDLQLEIADVIKAVGLMDLEGDIYLDTFLNRNGGKLKFMHHQNIENVNVSHIHFFETISEEPDPFA